MLGASEMSDNGHPLLGGFPSRRVPSHGLGGRYLVDLMDDEHQTEATGGERDTRRARDAELVRAARAGDPAAFGTLFDDWFDRVHDVTRRIVRRSDLADEVAQDVFLSAWRRLDSLDQPEAFGGWILRIARNAALNRADRERRASAVDDEAMAVIAAAGSPAG